MEVPTGGQAKEHAQTIIMKAMVKGCSGGGREVETLVGLMRAEQEVKENGREQETIVELIGVTMTRRCSSTSSTTTSSSSRREICSSVG
jgi:hypothetical protein